MILCMRRVLLSAVSVILTVIATKAQFVQADFKANCDCKFEKEYQKPAPGGYMVTAYKCVDKKLGDVSLYRVMLMDLSKDYKQIPRGRENDYINGYYSSLVSELQNAKIATDERSLNGKRSIEYQQMVKYNGESLPQKTAVFVSDKKSITLQLLSSSPLIDRQFDDFRNSFVLLNK